MDTFMIPSEMLLDGNIEWRFNTELLTKIQRTHSKAAEPIPQVADLITIVENTLQLTPNASDLPSVQENPALAGLGSFIHKISCELASNCSGCCQGSLEQRTLKLLILLMGFNWEAKIAVTLAGFATNYAEYFLIDKVYTDNTTAKGLLQLKRLGQKDADNNIGGAVKGIVENVTNIIKTILEIKKIQDEASTIPVHDNHFESASFWIIYAVLICSLKISSHGVITEHESAVNKIDVIYDYFNRKLKKCLDHEDEEKMKREYKEFDDTFHELHNDNMAILKLLLNCNNKEDWAQWELIYSKDRTKDIKLSDLQKGTVIVLFSSLYIDAYSEEVSLIEAFSKKKNTNNDQYDIVWFPIGHMKDQETYDNNARNKPWYYLDFEFLKKQNVVLEKYARKEWGFNDKPMLMVLEKGRVIHHDALSLIHMWGHLALPFGKYEDLWKEHSNSLGFQFIVDCLHDDLAIQETSGTSQYVCVFGGRWPQKSSGDETNEKEEDRFADLAGKLMAATIPANIELKMAYLWANEEEAALETNINTNVELTITNDSQYKQNMQYVKVEKTSTNIFWSRAESIALQLTMKKKNDTLDENMKALLENTESLLKFNVLSTAWVAIGQLGKNDMIFHDAEKFSSCLGNINAIENLKKWEEVLKSNSGYLIGALRDWLKNYKYDIKPIKKHCFKHVVHGDGMQKGGMHCVICTKPMRKVVLYECCNEKED